LARVPHQVYRLRTRNGDEGGAEGWVNLPRERCSLRATGAIEPGAATEGESRAATLTEVPPLPAAGKIDCRSNICYNRRCGSGTTGYRRGGEMSIFPTTILLATDGSREAGLAARTAVDLAASTGSELHVVTAGRMFPTAAYEAYTETMEGLLRQEARQVLDEEIRKIEEAGGMVAGSHVRMGDRRDEAIVRLAEEIGAGLIVMGSRGLGGVRRALMGSVSDSVVRHAHCPVLIVRPERETGGSRRFWRRERATANS
jgi:nucleotide-binding universal stress UspA family protein